MRDLLLNLLAELVGLVVGLIATYLIIERALKKREKKRWSLSSQFIYARTYSLVNDFLGKVVDTGSITGKAPESYTHCFGEARVTGDEALNKIARYTIWSHLHRTAELAVWEGKYDRSPMETLQKEISSIVGPYLPLLEPEAAAHLLALHNQLETFLTLTSDFASVTEFELWVLLQEVVDKAMSVRSYLEHQADRSIATDTYMQEVMERLSALKPPFGSSPEVVTKEGTTRDTQSEVEGSK